MYQVSQKKNKIYISAIFAIIILSSGASLTGVQDIVENLKNMSKQGIIFATFIYATEWPLRGIRYKTILARLNKHYGILFLTESIFISQLANVLLPARIGDIARVHVLKRKVDLPVTTGLSSLAVERICDITAITLIAFLTILMVSSMVTVYLWVISTIYLGGIIVLVFFIFLCASVIIKGNISYGLIGKISNPCNSVKYLNKIKHFIFQLIREILIFASDPKSFISSLLLSIYIWIIDIITCFAVLASFQEVHFSVSMVALIFLAVAVGTITKMFPVTPGAIGTYEVAVVAIFGLAGIEPSIAFIVAVVDHLIKNCVTVFGGGISLYSLGIKWNEESISLQNTL
ncbi:lysylphosphatidylglycerol synthase transmembrane domain-containing protein [Methanosarcina acetivorans]|uniref:lysylphosphatidylglycerol synthase transmembrane domain-containing protein n=1 Tax=Methanosarcina acetivorans TaxID=2214 RepID=UPI00064F0699|nr:lysylphosphatidylglycerol synthase transmembrane domain-containing protein [Methanosarcina acetivorans]